MSITLRLLLIIVPTLVLIYIVARIKKLKMKAEDAFFWLAFSVVLVVLGIFPVIAISVSEWLGIISPANFVFLVMIALLLFKVFSLSTKLAILDRKIQTLTQTVAVEEKSKIDEEKNNV